MNVTIARRAVIAVTALALAGTTVTGVGATRAHAAQSYCTHPQLGGAFQCEYGVSWVNYPNGQDQALIVGLDYAVWENHGFPGAFGGWKSMGGTVRSPIYVTNNNTETPKLTVRGTDGRWWHKQRYSSGLWSNWVS
ncbi:hypothetical protein [Streptomyces sp. CAU 1734]|uniref:hypothetical protein n=1 Tax=Streptomyces sp. CAU 1734 TaxID=3140360 RepID=UPI0032612425